MEKYSDDTERINSALARPHVQERLKAIESTLKGLGALEVRETLLGFAEQIASLILEKQWNRYGPQQQDTRTILVEENNEVLMEGGAKEFIEDAIKKILPLPKGRKGIERSLERIFISATIEISLETRAMIHSLSSEDLLPRPSVRMPSSDQYLIGGGAEGGPF